MKKFLLCLLAVLMTVPALSAESSSYDDFKRGIVGVNERCPIDYSPLGYISSIVLTESPRQLTYTLEVTDESAVYEEYCAQQQQFRQYVSQAMCRQSMRFFIQTCIEYEVAFCFRYKWNDGKTMDILFTPGELNAIINNVEQSQISSSLVEQMIEMEAGKCPRQVDEGMIERSVYRVDDNVCYEIQFDEEMYEVDIFDAISADQGLKRLFFLDMVSQPAVRTFMQSVIECGYNIVFVFVGNSSDYSCEIKLTNAELREIIK